MVGVVVQSVVGLSLVLVGRKLFNRTREKELPFGMATGAILVGIGSITLGSALVDLCFAGMTP